MTEQNAGLLSIPEGSVDAEDCNHILPKGQRRKQRKGPRILMGTHFIQSFTVHNTQTKIPSNPIQSFKIYITVFTELEGQSLYCFNVSTEKYL